YDTSDYDGRFWMDHSSFKPMKISRRKRCCSCKDLIKINTDTIEFYYYRSTTSDVEERIYGETKPLASSFMCEECSGLYLALEEVGYGCLDIEQPMKDYVAEYNDMLEDEKEWEKEWEKEHD
ncbi:unnamed protein product, partial [marine sediment metagenome]